MGSRYDDRYGYPGAFALMKCGKCGHVFLDVKFTPDQLRDLYSNYYPRSTFNLDDYIPYQERSGFGAWLDGERSSPFRWVPQNVRVLDIGCGFGESLGYHRARGCDVYGVEADENIRRVAEKFGFNVHVGLFDQAVYEANFFDFVTMSQVIEHVVDPLQGLRGIAQILRPGGVVVLSTPAATGWGASVFGRRWINWHAPYHLHFFSAQSMRLAAQQAGLTIEKSVTITPSAWLLYQWIHLISYPQEGRKSIFWTPGGKWSFLQKILLKALYLINTCRINHVISRFFDSMGLGDNQIYILRKQ